MRFLVVMILICSGWLLQAQDTTRIPIIISGVVFDQDSLTPLPNAHYRLDRRNLAGSTNFQGRFRAIVEPHDTLRFTHVGYKDSYYIISDTLFPGEYLVGIFMDPDTILLEEVVVLPRFRNLRQQIMALEVPPDPALANARRNLEVSTYQGLTGEGIPWDAEMSQQIQSFRMQQAAMNLGMISPNQMVGINFIAVIPYLLFKLGTQEDHGHDKEIFIAPEEYNFLLEQYRQSLYQGRTTKKDTIR